MSGQSKEGILVGLIARKVSVDKFLSAKLMNANQPEQTEIFTTARDSGISLHQEPGLDLAYGAAKLLARFIEIAPYAMARYQVVLNELVAVEKGLDIDPANTFITVDNLEKQQEKLVTEKSQLMKMLKIEPIPAK